MLGLFRAYYVVAHFVLFITNPEIDTLNITINQYLHFDLFPIPMIGVCMKFLISFIRNEVGEAKVLDLSFLELQHAFYTLGHHHYFQGKIFHILLHLQRCN